MSFGSVILRIAVVSFGPKDLVTSRCVILKVVVVSLDLKDLVTSVSRDPSDHVTRMRSSGRRDEPRRVGFFARDGNDGAGSE